MKSLREWRDERVLSTRELAKLAGVARQTIISAERGATVPHRRVMRQLAEALGVEPREISEFASALERSDDA